MESYVVPAVEHQTGFGSGYPLPPVREGDDGDDGLTPLADEDQMELWQRRVPLAGAEIAPGEWFSLIVGVVPENGAGDTSEWPEIRYRVGSRDYVSFPGIGAKFLGPADCG
ncbi:MAG: hypothetical protein LBJ02_01460 [Bifidobacteriaceae bacterium]|nr:hypothetical protein [Bifidobacteriaceae bacterium]